MKPFMRRILVCVVPVLLSALIVGMATHQYLNGQGGFKLGVDLVGGTILIYEIDQDKQLQGKEVSGDELAAALKRRIDPTDLYNVIIRPLSNTRVEIILPTGGAHQAAIEEQQWQELLQKVQAEWPELQGVDFEVSAGQSPLLAQRTQQELEKTFWKELLAEVAKKWPDQLKDAKLEAAPGRESALTEELKKAGVPTETDEVKQFLSKAYKKYQDQVDSASRRPLQDADGQVKSSFQNKKKNLDQLKGEEVVAEFIEVHTRMGGKRRFITGERVDEIKNLIKQVGSLEFRILANARDDQAAIEAARTYFTSLTDPRVPEEKKKERRTDLENNASRGLPPPRPQADDGSSVFHWKNEHGEGDATYSWIELGKQERYALGLDNAAENPSPERQRKLQEQRAVGRWQEVAKAREEGRPIILPGFGETLLYSRRCTNYKLPPNEQAQKRFEYFILARDPEPDKKVTGKYLTSAREDIDKQLRPAVHFSFNNQGGALFYELTSQNRPTGRDEAGFFRHLAIILDDFIVSAPRLNEAIRTDGQISGSFTRHEVDQLVRILRSGALPATLKPLPVSENTIGPTLGADTIYNGTVSVFLAFGAVLIFMLAYYRFAGLVACVALFANLLLTIAFMVLVNATFTLPGLAGLVLMLAMAVDANVLIYERLREERDRGASLALAIRNGYDRAFPTIIDTHLTSIFTAIVLYAVGNDQLKGFGISLTVGLIISLFTSLYMTRLMFDLWQAKGWLHKLSMARLLSNPNIDFMRVRKYWFTATVLLSLFGVSVFLVRGQQGLNIDFTGGTAYTGVLRDPMDLARLRKLLSEHNQQVALGGVEVKETSTDDSGLDYTITYLDAKGQKEKEQPIKLPNPPLPVRTSTPEERAAKVKQRASELPDWSVEQIFTSREADQGDNSSYFTVRTSEKAPELVQAIIDRLLRDETGKPLLRQIRMKGTRDGEGAKDEFEVKGRTATLKFVDAHGNPTPASPGQVKMLLEREAELFGVKLTKVSFDVIGKGKGIDGRFTTMELQVSGTGAETDKLTPEKLQAILERTKEEFARRPQPERLENFDSALAADTQARALYAILASWGAILLYLWFRFGSWTFGMAAVLCLIHDLIFTLGIIAFCHYLVAGVPWLASLLMLQDFKIDLPAVAALLTLVGYSVNDTIVVFDRIREVRGKNPELTEQMINDSVNQTLSRTLLTSFITWLTVIVLYIRGGDGVHLFAFVMVVGVVIGTYSSIYVASPLLLIFGEGRQRQAVGERAPEPEAAPESEEEEEEEESAATAERITTQPTSKDPDERTQEKE
jgi:SecD/SecF fusion protein